MSWQVDGVVYHDFERYRSALARREANLAQRVAAEAARNVQNLQARVAEREREIASARRDLQRQSELNAGLRNDVSALRRAQNELSQHQREAEANLNRQLEAARRDQAATNETLARVEREHADHAAATRTAFADVDRQIRKGLAQAERQLGESEARLKQEIASVDNKVEADRADRVRREVSDLDRAAERSRMAEEELEQLTAGTLEALDLGETHAAIHSRIGQARVLHQRGDASAALATAFIAHSDARVLGHTAVDRQARLVAARESVKAEINYLRELMLDKDVQRFFKQELEEVKQLLGSLERRADGGYQRYAWLATEQADDNGLLAGERARLLAMISRAPVLRDLAGDRKIQLEQILERLVAVNGRAGHSAVSYADPEDLKSDLIVSLGYENGNIKMRVPLEGDIKIDGHKYGSNTSCHHAAAAVVQALTPMMQLGSPQLDTVNRVEPAAGVNHGRAVLSSGLDGRQRHNTNADRQQGEGR